MALSPDQISHKIAARDLVRANGGFEVAAAHCRVSKSLLQRQCDERNPANECDFMAIDVVADLELRTRGQPGWPHVTRALAGNLGFALMELPAAEPKASDWHAHIAALSTELSDIVRGLCAALADDHRVSADEAIPLLADTGSALVAIVNLRAALEAVRDGNTARDGRG